MKISPAAERLLAKLEAKERGQQRERTRPVRQIVLDPTWPFASAPIGALAGKNPLDEGD